MTTQGRGSSGRGSIRTLVVLSQVCMFICSSHAATYRHHHYLTPTRHRIFYPVSSAMSSNQLAASRRAVVSGSPTSPWWSTLDKQTVDALSDDLGDHAGVRRGQRSDVRRPDWSVSGAHLRPRQYEFLTAWRLINGRRPLGSIVHEPPKQKRQPPPGFHAIRGKRRYSV